jgi:hypothetical protein
MFTKLLTTIMLAGATAFTTVYAGNDDLTKASSWKGKPKEVATEVTTGQHSGASCLQATGYTQLFSNKLFKIDPAKTYTVSGWFKSVGKQPGKLYFGFASYDKNKKSISSRSVMIEPGTDTVLAADCKPDDKVIKIKNGAKWKLHKYGLIAFKTDPNGEYSDLPNFNTSPPAVIKVEQQGDIWELTLSNPCGKAFAAGTPIREQYTGPGYQYCASSNKKIPTEWTKLSATVKGIAMINVPADKFWPGTAYVKIMMLMNYQAKDGEVMLWDDIKLEEK